MHTAAVFMFIWICPASASYLGQWVGLSSQLTTTSHHHKYIIVWQFFKFLVFLIIPTGLHMFSKMLTNCTELQKYTMHVHSSPFKFWGFVRLCTHWKTLIVIQKLLSYSLYLGHLNYHHVPLLVLIYSSGRRLTHFTIYLHDMLSSFLTCLQMERCLFTCHHMLVNKFWQILPATLSLSKKMDQVNIKLRDICKTLIVYILLSTF